MENEYPSATEVAAQYNSDDVPTVEQYQESLGAQVAPAAKKPLDPLGIEITDLASDSLLAERIARMGVGRDPRPMLEYLRWTKEKGWLLWTGRVWSPIPDPQAVEHVRLRLKAAYVYNVENSPNPQLTAKINGKLLTRKKAADVAFFLKGILTIDFTAFDSSPDLINCPNGVVDLRTRKLYPHEAGYMMTKMTKVAYNPKARHDDWERALDAVPDDTHDFLQLHYGQGITGYPVDDDRMLVQTGGGSNGKSTLDAAIVAAIGDYGVYVPDKVLLANPNDHPTELMTLRGARFALIEETPEGHHLPTARLKKIVGTPRISARAMRQDNVEWDASHSLILNTNYIPQVAETDDGTWRRLALVKFPYKFVDPSKPLMAPNERHGDPGLRERLRFNTDDQLEAVLAWLVQGAQAWYDLGGYQGGGLKNYGLPASVQRDTDAWRAEADLILAYAYERLTFEPGTAVLSKELFADFSLWLKETGRTPWNDQTFASRFGGHDLCARNHVTKDRPTNPKNVDLLTPGFTPEPTGKVTVWSGVKFNPKP